MTAFTSLNTNDVICYLPGILRDVGNSREPGEIPGYQRDFLAEKQCMVFKMATTFS